MEDTFWLVWVLILVLGVATIFAGAKTVPQGQVWTVERFGTFRRELHPGRHFVAPFIDSIGCKLDMGEQVRDIPRQKATTLDKASVAVDGVIHFQVTEPAKAAYQAANLGTALPVLAMTQIQAVIGEMEIEAALFAREDINARLRPLMDGATAT